METTVTIDIKSTPDVVWQVMTDVERWHEWTASITNVNLHDDALEVGASATVKQPKVPAATWTVTDLQPGESFTWENKSPGMRSVGIHELRDLGAYGVAVTLTVRQTGIAALLMRPWLAALTKRYINMEAVGLKRRCEALVPAEAFRAAS